MDLWSYKSQEYYDGYLNPREILAQRATKLLLGRGVSITHPEDIAQKRLEDIIKYNELYGMFWSIERECSLNGDMFIGVEFRDGMPVIYSNDAPEQSPDNRVAYVNRQMQVAAIWRRQIVDDFHWFVLEIHTANEIRRMYLANGKWVKAWNYTEKVPEALQLPVHEVHNEGRLRVVRIPNLYNNFGYSQPDDYAVKGLIELINTNLDAICYELETNRTVIAGHVSSRELNTFKKDLKKQGIKENEEWKFAKGLRKAIRNGFIKVKGKTNGDAQPPIQVFGADPKLEAYWKAYWQAMDSYMSGSGYARQDKMRNDSLGGGNAELSLQLRSDYETTQIKKAIRSERYKDIIKIALELDIEYGYGDIYGDINDNITIDIKDTFAVDSKEALEKVQIELQLGLISRCEAIAKLRGIPKTEAEQILSQIDTESQTDPFNPMNQKDETQDGEQNG